MDHSEWENFYRGRSRKIKALQEKASKINARIWAPLWKEGLQKDKLDRMHRQRRRVFVWTVDQPEQMRQFMDGGYDGLGSNYPSPVACYYYTRNEP